MKPKPHTDSVIHIQYLFRVWNGTKTGLLSTTWVASPWGFSEMTIQPARHEFHACCPLGWKARNPARSRQHACHSCRAGCIVISENPQGLATHIVLWLYLSKVDLCSAISLKWSLWELSIDIGEYLYIFRHTLYPYSFIFFTTKTV